MREVTTSYLEMLDAGWLRGKGCPEPVLELRECVDRDGEFFKYLYETVGKGWNWRERLVWSGERWEEHGRDENVRVWAAKQGEEIAGYFELIRRDVDTIEIGYFGLKGEYFGKGYGGYLLTEAIREAWAWGAKRVWVHTCSDDHENALGNYIARGMKVFKEETVEED